ncbi:MAG: type II/IV secretion system ATPase subunit, partial [Nitrososphaerota archaeon]
KLKKEMAEESPNVLYPVSDNVFIQIIRRKKGERTEYNIIEPVSGHEYSTLFQIVEELMAYRIGVQYEYKDIEGKKDVLLKLLDEVVKVDQTIKDIHHYRIVGKNDNRVVYVSKDAKDSLKYVMVRDKVGIGPLEPMILDAYSEDISCDGIGPVFVEHKVFRSCVSNLKFEDHDELDEYTKRLAERVGKPVSYRSPIVDGTLPDGSRFNLVFGKDISRRGTNFTIRKFSKTPISITQLCLWNTISYLGAAYLWILLESGTSVWVSGETASGKTTTLNAICTFIKPDAKIVSVEDTPEVIVPHENWVREVTKESEGGESRVDLYDLLKAALRQRPNYIIVGEIRGREGNVAFQAMQTGHPVLCTFHASSVQKLIQRLTGSPIEVPKTYIDNIGAIVIQSAVRLPKTGKVERRVLSINELVGYDPVDDRFNYIELMSWDPSTDSYIFKGEGSSYLLESKIALSYGYTRKDVRKIYHHLQTRAELLRILAEAGVTDYFELWDVIKTINDIGIETALDLMRSGKLFKRAGPDAGP